MSENHGFIRGHLGKLLKRKPSNPKFPTPQTLVVRASLLAAAVSTPLISGLQTSGSFSGAAGVAGKSPAVNDQPDDHDTTVAEHRRIGDGDRSSSGAIGHPLNLGPQTESPWEIAFRGLNPDQRGALSRYNFQIQRPTELFETEIGHIRDLRDRCDRGLVTGDDNKAFMTRGRVHNILRKVEKYVKIGDIAIQHHPEIVALIWAGLRMSLQVALNDLATFERLSSVLDDIATAMYACKIYENLYTSSVLMSAKAVMDRLSPMYAACLKVVAEAIIYSEEKTSTRMGKGITNPFETRFQPLIDDIDGEKKKLETYAQAVPHESLAKLSKALDAGEREKTLKWISTVRYGDHHDDVKASRLPGTGEWLFQNRMFTSWLECEHSSLLWLHGKAGSGKTILSSIVTDALTATYISTPTIYFYCKFNEQPRKEAYSIIRALLKQLSVASEILNPEILAAFRSAREKGEPTTSLSRSDAERLFTGAMSQTGEAFVVLDALDECEEEERKVLISFLRKLLALDGCQVKIFLTSRPEDGLHRSFKDSQSKDILTYRIDVDDTVQDIGPFVTQRVDELIESKALLYGTPVTQDFREHLITTLIQEADGVFLWARYQLEIICELGSESEIRTQLTQLPKGLETTYMRIWDKIRSFPKMKSSRAYRTIKWLLSATRPLKREEIIIATAIKPLDTTFQVQEEVSLEYLISACGNLVYLDEQEDVLRLVHFSAQEFLVRQPELKDPEGFVAVVCFTALGFSQRPAAIWDYAVDNWWRHARCWREINSARSTLIGRFLLVTPRLEEWLTDFGRLYRREKVLLPPSKYGAIGVCASFDLPIILSHLLQRGLKHFGGHFEGGFSKLISAALLLAAAEGHLSIVELLIKAGANTRWRMSGYVVTFQLSSQIGYRNGITARLSPSERGGSMTALQAAAVVGHDKVLKLLLKADAGVNDQGHFKLYCGPAVGTVTCETALQAVCVNGNEKVAGLLISAGAAVDAQGGDCGTPLQAAALGGQGEIVEMLLKAGADAKTRNYFPARFLGTEGSCTTALQAACVRDDKGVAEMLISAGAAVDALGGNRGTALQIAAAGGHGGMVEILLKAGADAKIEDSFLLYAKGHKGSCRTALQAACVNGDERVVRLLVNAGAVVNALGGESGTALQAAAGSGDAGVVELLLEAGADANIEEPFLFSARGHEASCRTALQAACVIRSERVARLLVNAGAAVNAQGGECGTALQAAIAGGHWQVVRLLLNAGANANDKHPFRLPIKDPREKELVYGSRAGILCETALQVASVKGDVKTVELLINAGADVDALGGECGTALQAAAAGGHEEVVEMLLEADADVNLRNSFRYPDKYSFSYPDEYSFRYTCKGNKVPYYETALQAASEQGFAGVVKLLLNAGANA